MPERTKRTRPCDACRRRKTKCVTNADESVCVLCRFHAQECTYDEKPKPRKRGASTTTKAELSPLSRHINVSHLHPGTGVEEYDALPGQTLLRRTLGLQNLHHSRYIGSNDLLSVVYDGGDPPPRQLQRSPKVRLVDICHAFEILPDAGTPGYAEETTMLHEIERAAKGNGPELVKLFFRIVHPSFPILHKDVFLEKYNRSFTEFSPPLLAAVYLLASGYWSFSEVLAASPMPDLSVLKTLAWKCFQSTTRRPKLSTIQAGLLLSQHRATDSTVSTPDQPPDLTAQLVDVAYTLGLHLDATGWEIPEWEICLRRRLSWAIFVHDKWTALLQGRPSLIHPENWVAADLTLDDFPESTEDEAAGSSEVHRGRLVFINMVGLTVILSNILQDLLCLRFQQMLQHAEDGVSTLLSQLKQLQISLKDWFTSLPEPLKMDTVASMKLSSVGYLRLAYLTVETCIHRLIIRTISQTTSVDAALVRICRSAASERFNNAVDFMQRLQASHLASFWYFTSAQCCVLTYHFGLLLANTAIHDEEKAGLDRKLGEYSWSLKVNGEAGTTFMKQALSMIRSSTSTMPYTSVDRASAGDAKTAMNIISPLSSNASTTYTNPVMHHVEPTHNGNQRYEDDIFQSSIDGWTLSIDENVQDWEVPTNMVWDADSAHIT